MTATAASLEIKFSSDTKGAERGIDQMAGKVRGLGGVMQTALGFAAGSFIRDAVRGFGDLIGGALDFEAAMANVNSIAQLSGSQIDALGDQVNALATDTAQAPQVLAAGLYDIYSAGFKGQQAMDILEASANAATAGLSTTAVAANAMTGVLLAFTKQSYSSQQVSDLLFQTVNDGKVTFDALAANMGTVLPAANSLGIGLEEVGAAYARMSLQFSASQAETRIAALLRAAVNPTEDLTAAIKAQGYESAQSLIQQEGLTGFLESLTTAAHGSNETLFDLLGTQEAYDAALNLGGDNLTAYTTELDKMKNSAGATDKALAKQMQSAQFQLRKAKIAVQQAATVFIGTLAPGIALAAEGFTALVTHGLIPAVEWFDRAVHGLDPLANALRAAFIEGVPISQLVEFLPARFQALEQPVLRIADSIGDLWAAFQTGGLSGLGDQIAEEVGSIIDSIGELANIAVDVVIDGTLALAGDLETWAGDLWGWVKRELYGGNGTYGSGDPEVQGLPMGTPQVSFGTVLIDAGLAAAGQLADWAGDLWGWVKDKLGVGTTVMGDGTGGPATDRTLTFGDVLINAVLALGGEIKRWAGNLHGWIIDQLQGYTGLGSGGAADLGHANTRDADFDLGDLYVTAAIQLTGDLVNLDNAITKALGLQATPQSLKNAHEAGAKAAQDHMTAINQGIADGITRSSGGEGGVDGGFNLWDTVKSIWNWGPPGFDAEEPSIIDEWSQYANGYASAIHEAVVGAVQKVFLGEDTQMFTPEGTPVMFHQNGLLNDLMDFLNTPIDLGALANPFAGLGDTITGWIGGELQKAKDHLVNNEMVKIIGDLLSGDFSGFIRDVGAGGGGGGAAPPAMAMPDFSSVVSRSAIMQAEGALGGGGHGFNPVVSLDTSAFDTKRQEVLDHIKELGEQKPKPTVELDSVGAQVALSALTLAGSAFDLAIFQATLDFDTGPAAIAYTDAFGWGDTFAAQTFTASLSFDTSALDTALAHAYAVVGEIASIMPHSPADRGPLSRPISFGYIADNLLATMDAMRGHADRGMNELADRMNRRVGIGGIGYGAGGGIGGSAARQITVNPTVHINAPVYGVNDLRKTIQDAFVDEAFPALFDAIDRQDRANGAQA